MNNWRGMLKRLMMFEKHSLKTADIEVIEAIDLRSVDSRWAPNAEDMACLTEIYRRVYWNVQ